MEPTSRIFVKLESESVHKTAFASTIGRTHLVNQDAGGVWTWSRQDGTCASLLVTADGVSAGRHSEIASRHTVLTLHQRIAPLMSDESVQLDDLLEALLEAAKKANDDVSSRPHESVGSADATTLAAAVCLGPRAAGVWCGDSRVYRLTSERAERLTQDHSWAAGVVREGLMTANDAARDPRAHMITRWLGPPHREDPGLEAYTAELQPSDVLLCCTDGLYMYFAPPAADESEMARVLASNGDLASGVQTLVREAQQRGGRDDITIAALQLT